MIDYESLDYDLYLSPWYDYFNQNGRWDSLGASFSSYYTPYLCLLSATTFLPIQKLYSIKLLSIVFDYAAALLVFSIVKCKYGGWLPIVAGVGTLFLPTVILNSSQWGQCDVIYTSALLATLLSLLKQRPLLAMVMYGVALAFKPQAIFLSPLLVGLAIRGDIAVKYLLLAPLIFICAGGPSLLAGKPWPLVVFHWFLQHNSPGLSLGASNWYAWLTIDNDQFLSLFGYGMATVAALYAVRSVQKLQEHSRLIWTMESALFSSLSMPFFLPGMHERYFYLADILSFVYAFYVPVRWWIPVLVQAASYCSYQPYLNGIEFLPLSVLATFVAIAIATVGHSLASKPCQPPLKM